MGTGGGDGSETGTVTEEGKQKSMTNIGASLMPDFRDKEISVPASCRTSGIEISVPASCWTSGIKRYRCQLHAGLLG